MNIIHNKKINLLCIEDEIQFSDYILYRIEKSSKLKDLINNTYVCESIEQINNIIENNKIDIILLDLNIKGSVGINTFKSVSS